MDVSARLTRVRETGDHSRNTSIMLDSIECVIPVECVVRNICAGSMATCYGIPEGTQLREPVFEVFLKSDSSTPCATTITPECWDGRRLVRSRR